MSTLQSRRRPSKHKNQPLTVNGEKYRSKREYSRHCDLLLMQRAGLIAGLVREVPFVLAKGVKIDGEARARPALRYYADFVYSDVDSGRVIVEDAKGQQTPVYRMKKHLMATVHAISVLET